MTTLQQIVTIALAALITQLCRWLPFLVFKPGREIPTYIHYLGRVLPPAIFAMIVIYCYRDIDVLHGDHGLPIILCGLLVAALQYRFKNMCLSIVIGTVLYMLWVNGA